MLMPAKKQGGEEFSQVESQIVTVYRVEEDGTLVMETPGQTYTVHPDEIDTHWWETYQLMFGFEWEYNDEPDWNSYENEEERNEMYRLWHEEVVPAIKAGKI